MSTKDKAKETKSKNQSKNGKGSETPLLSDILPLPDPKFHGRIGKTYVDSEPDIISLRTPPAK